MPEHHVEDVVDDAVLLRDSLCLARVFANNIIFA